MCDYESIFLNGYTDDMNLCSPIDPQCVCCKSTEGVFVPLSSCLHSSLISDFFKLEIKLAQLLLCIRCHTFLKKVDAFKKNLEQNLHLLNIVDPEVKHHRFHHLTATKIRFLSINDYNNHLIDNVIGDQQAFSDSGESSNAIDKNVWVPNVVKEDVKISEVPIDITIDIKPEPSTSLDSDHSYSTINIQSNNKEKVKSELNCEMKSKTSNQISNKTMLSVNSITSGKHIQHHNPGRNPNANNSLPKLLQFPKISLPSLVPLWSPMPNLERTKQESTNKLALVNEKQINGEKCPPTIMVYEGIQEIKLTIEELMKERAEARLKQSYLSLPFKCETCIIGFTYEEKLMDHNRLKHTPRPDSYTCEVCKSVLRGTMNEEHRKRHMIRYKCVPCGRVNITLRAIVDHHNREHGAVGDGLYYCNHCDFEARSRRELYHHKRRHRDKVTCTVCEAQFYSNSTVRTHMLNVHTTSSKTYQCEKCPKVFNKIASFRTHIANYHREVESDKVFRCEECNTFYNSAVHLRNHLKNSNAHLSMEQRKYFCDYCGQRFLSKTHMRDHILFVHLKSQEHKCKICGKVYRNARVLKQHVMTVHEKVPKPRNKICQYCGKGFHTREILLCHIRTHTGERPLKCQHCPADFAHGAALYNHKKLVHGVTKKNQTPTESSNAKHTKQRNLKKIKETIPAESN